MNSENNNLFGVVFDLDGTLLDSTELISQIPKELEGKYKVSLDSTTSDEIREKIMSALKGRSGRFLIIRLILYVARKYNIPWFLRLKYLQDTANLYRQKIKDVPIFPGVKEAIKILNQKGIPIAINTTSSGKEVIDRFDGRMAFLEMFSGMVVTRSDVKKMKPHPESILKISEKMGIPTKHLVMVGDMDADIFAGKNSGCITVGVLSGYASKEMMQEYDPDFIIESVKEFPLLLPKLYEKIHSR
jgi:pyrophosphatase PpaX